MEARLDELNRDPDKLDDMDALEGEVIQLVTDKGEIYKITIKDRQLERADEDEDPTMLMESYEEVIISIVKGELDPLEVLNTRKLMVKTDAARGRIMRRLFFGEDF